MKLLEQVEHWKGRAADPLVDMVTKDEKEQNMDTLDVEDNYGRLRLCVWSGGGAPRMNAAEVDALSHVPD